MNDPKSTKSAPRAVRTETAAYLFAIGQDVRLKQDFLQRSQKLDVYRIVGTLPPLGDSPQYRIRSEGEPHDRVAAQGNLELSTTTFNGAKTNSAEDLFDKAKT